METATEAEARPREQVAREIVLVVVCGLIQLGGTALAARHQPERGHIGAAGVALLVLGLIGLPVRLRFPVPALWLTLAATATYWGLGYPRGPVFPALIVVFANAVLTGHRRAPLGSPAAGLH